MNPKLKSLIQYAVLAGVAVFFLYFVFKGTDWDDLLEKFRLANYWWIAAGMATAMFSHIVRGYRATMLYEALQYKVPVKNSVYAVLIGYMMNYIIPRAGEVSRCAAITKTDDVPLEKSLGTVITERIFDMVILLLILALVFVLQFDLLSKFIGDAFKTPGQPADAGISLKLVLGLGLVASIVLIFLLRKRLMTHSLFGKVMKLITGFVEGLMSIRQIKKPLLFVALSVVIWICYVLMMYFCFFAMEATSHLDFIACLTVFAIGTIGVVIPAPGAGAGTYHFFIMQSLLLFGVPQTDGIAYATIVHGMQMVLLLVIGAICSLLVLAQHKQRAAISNT